MSGAGETSRTAENVRTQFGVGIPMRDGVRLSATLYLPQNHPLPSPAIATLTPYTAQFYHERGMYFASRGFPFLIVDVRGRGNSGGDFRPFIQEASDGYDVIEWLATQPYCDGKVGMWGGSYAGYAQWVTAAGLPPHLATIVPGASPYLGVDFPMRNNIPTPYVMQWLTLISGRTLQERIFVQREFWSRQFHQLLKEGLSFQSLDGLVGNPSATFQEWVTHPRLGEYWDKHNPTAKQYSQLTLPILSITGAYDGDQPGALTHYREHIKHAEPMARSRHYLIIGPWDHPGTGTPQAEFAGLKIKPAGVVDLAELHLQWFAWTLRGGPKPSFLRNNVMYYVTSQEEWYGVEALDKIGVSSTDLSVASTGGANDPFISGSLTPTPNEASATDCYVYDPTDIEHLELECSVDPESRVDQRMVLAMAGKQLIYHTAPFPNDLTIAGFFRFSAWLSINQPDTDFRVAIYDIDHSGGSVFLSDDLLRARHRVSLYDEQLISSEESQLLKFERFTFVARRIERGHRLRLVVGPIHSIYKQKNYNSGGVVATESLQDARVVRVKLFHDPTHPSILHIPIGQHET